MRMLKLKRLTIQSVDKDVELLIYSSIVGGKTNMKLTIWKIIWQFLTNICLPYGPAIPLLAIYPRDMNVYVHKMVYRRISIEALSIVAQTGNYPTVYKQENKQAPCFRVKQ